MNPCKPDQPLPDLQGGCACCLDNASPFPGNSPLQVKASWRRSLSATAPVGLGGAADGSGGRPPTQARRGHAVESRASDSESSGALRVLSSQGEGRSSR